MAHRGIARRESGAGRAPDPVTTSSPEPTPSLLLQRVQDATESSTRWTVGSAAAQARRQITLLKICQVGDVGRGWSDGTA